MKIRVRNKDYNGDDLSLHGEYKLAVICATETSAYELENRHGTMEADRLQDVWFVAVSDYDPYMDRDKIVSRSPEFESKDTVLAALTSEEGVSVGFEPYLWLFNRKGNAAEVRAFSFEKN